MTDSTQRPKQPEAYMHAYNGALTEQIIAGRTAEVHGAFFLPYLHAGMTVLDCGCGPGSITLGLAKAAFPGDVTGVDIEEGQVERARAQAAERGLANVTFARCDVQELPYRDDKFDAVFSHAMVEHMPDPLAVLKEMRRVLKPGGVVGVRSIDLAGTLMTPEEARLTKAHDLWIKYRQHCGGDPFMGRRLRALLREAGFANTRGTASSACGVASPGPRWTASSETWGTAQLTQSMVPVLKDEFTGPKIMETAIRMGWADQAEMNSAALALDDWGTHADAFMAILWCEAVGWKERT